MLEILENLEILEILQTVANKGESDHLLEILETLELAPKVVLGKLGLLTPNLRNFSGISEERVKFRDPRKFKIFTPPLIFGDLTPLSRSAN